jgi:hypothetical protein
VPLLNLVCPPCGRFLERRRRQKDLTKARAPIGVVPHKTS